MEEYTAINQETFSFSPDGRYINQTTEEGFYVYSSDPQHPVFENKLRGNKILSKTMQNWELLNLFKMLEIYLFMSGEVMNFVVKNFIFMMTIITFIPQNFYFTKKLLG